MKRVGIIISGRGSNMVALVDATRDGTIPTAEVAVVISNNAAAKGLDQARQRGIETVVHDHRGVSREEHDRRMAQELRQHGVDLVCLAGYMRLLSPWFIAEFESRILNVHPSLLPAFPGLDAQKQAFDYGVRATGCTVHLVDRELDHGPIVKQAVVLVDSTDTVDTLSERILAEEHRIYPEAVALMLSGKYHLVGRRFIESP
ncbi:MAG: phosphoribosylglycinamide formyltransferase [Blastocatellia bacterium]